MTEKVESLRLHQIGKQLNNLFTELEQGHRARAQVLKDAYLAFDPDGVTDKPCQYCIDDACPAFSGSGDKTECKRIDTWKEWLDENNTCHAEALAAMAFLEGRLTTEEFEWISGGLQG